MFLFPFQIVSSKNIYCSDLFKSPSHLLVFVDLFPDRFSLQCSIFISLFVTCFRSQNLYFNLGHAGRCFKVCNGCRKGGGRVVACNANGIVW